MKILPFAVFPVLICAATSNSAAQTPPAGIRAGWPVTLPGIVFGSVAAGQLDGSKSLEIVVAARADVRSEAEARRLKSQTLNTDAALYAYSSGGKPVDGFPVTLVKGDIIDADPERSIWLGSPGIADLDGDGVDEIIHNGPGKAGSRIYSYFGDGSKWPFNLAGNAPNPYVSLPIADVDGDGTWDFVSGSSNVNALGKPVTTWPSERRFKGGYQSVIGDGDGDGLPEVFHGFYDPDWGSKGPERVVPFAAFSHTGEQMWRKNLGNLVLIASMGDICGDERAEVVAIDVRGNLRAWHMDGTPVPGSTSETAPDGSVRDGLLKAAVRNFGGPVLADLDGDGKAEILGSTRAGALYALSGDGKPWKNGMLGAITGLNSYDGISVVDLGGDGVPDLFYGSKWIRVLPDGPQIRELVPAEAGLYFSAAPSIVDLDGDGLAEVLLGARDGRVWVYDTMQSLDAKGLQWHTTSGSFRHTGTWSDPKTRTPAREKWSQARWKP